MRNVDNFLHSRRSEQSLQLAAMLVSLAHHAPITVLFFAAAQVRLIAAFFNASHDVIDFSFCCAYCHIDDHGLYPRLVPSVICRSALLRKDTIQVFSGSPHDFRAR